MEPKPGTAEIGWENVTTTILAKRSFPWMLAWTKFQDFPTSGPPSRRSYTGLRQKRVTEGGSRAPGHRTEQGPRGSAAEHLRVCTGLPFAYQLFRDTSNRSVLGFLTCELGTVIAAYHIG